MIELLVVVTLLVAVSAVVSFNVRGLLGGGQLEANLERFVAFEDNLRVACWNRRQPVALQIDLSKNEIVISAAGVSQARFRDYRTRGTIELAGFICLQQLRVSTDRTRIKIDRNAMSSSYAIGFEHVDSREEAWIVVCGGTGKTLRMNDEQEARTMLESIQPAGVSRIDAG